MERFEKETIINYNEKETLASISTYDKKLIKKMLKYPTTFLLILKDEDYYEFTCDKKHITVSVPRIISEEERIKRASNMKINRRV